MCGLILKNVSEVYETSTEDIISNSRKAAIVEPRTLAIKLCLDLGIGEKTVAKQFTRDRTTLYNVIKSHQDWHSTNPHYRRVYEDLTNQFNKLNFTKSNVDEIQSITTYKIKPTDKIYVAGKISGLHKQDYERNFWRAETYLLKYTNFVYNPATICGPDMNWYECMRKLMPYIADANILVLLPNWVDSRGAIIEHDISVKLGSSVYLYDL